jgi:hypothetical protein
MSRSSRAGRKFPGPIGKPSRDTGRAFGADLAHHRPSTGHVLTATVSVSMRVSLAIARDPAAASERLEVLDLLEIRAPDDLAELRGDGLVDPDGRESGLRSRSGGSAR